MAINTPVCNFGIKAPDFELSDTEGKWWSLESLRGPRGLTSSSMSAPGRLMAVL